MLRMQDSHRRRNGNLLCGNLSATQSIDCSLLEYPASPQHLYSSNVVEPTPTPTSLAPMMTFDEDVHTFRPMDMMTFEYCAASPTFASRLPRVPDYYSTTDSRFVAEECCPFVPTSQSFDNSTNFEGMIFESPVAPLPPQPPTPEEFNPSNSSFHYHLCRWLGGPRCDGIAPGKNREMGEHLRVHHQFVGHERDTVQCEWQNCGHMMQRMNVARHIVSRHLLAAASCRFCGKRFSRPDVVTRHERTCSVTYPVSSSSSAWI